MASVFLIVLLGFCSLCCAMRLPNHEAIDVEFADRRMLMNDAALNPRVRYNSRSLQAFISPIFCKEGEKKLPPPVSRCVPIQEYYEYMNDDYDDIFINKI